MNHLQEPVYHCEDNWHYFFSAKLYGKKKDTGMEVTMSAEKE